MNHIYIQNSSEHKNDMSIHEITRILNIIAYCQKHHLYSYSYLCKMTNLLRTNPSELIYLIKQYQYIVPNR